MGIFSARFAAMKDEVLVQRLAKGQTGAFDELYGRYRDRLFHYFRRMLGQDEEKARDFLQDLFFKLVERPDRFALDGCFRTWIFSVAHNMCCNEYRRCAVRRDTILPLPPPPEAVDQRLDRQVFLRALSRELQDLDEIKRSTFLLRFQEGLSLQEIAQAMDCAVGTVKSRLFYVTRHLGQRLKSFHPQNEMARPALKADAEKTKRKTKKVCCDG
jgi:RNA polymerase sigma-70 factor, ECF subfamily